MYGVRLYEYAVQGPDADAGEPIINESTGGVPALAQLTALTLHSRRRGLEIDAVRK